MGRTDAVIDGLESRELVTVPVRHYWRWLVAVVGTVVAVHIVLTLVDNDNFDYGAVGEYLFDSRVLTGVGHTLLLTAIAMAAGCVLGLLSAAMRLSSNPLARSVSMFYTGFIRGTPVLVQLVVLFNLGLLVDRLTVGIPFTDVNLLEAETNDVMTPLLAAAVAFSLNEGAYMSEIFRGGLLSVDRGQTEAGMALGMRPHKVFFRIRFPQAIRVIIPPTGSELLNLLKLTSLVTVISYNDLLTSVTTIYSENFKTMELLVVAGIWYLFITSVLVIGQSFLERRFSRGWESGRSSTNRPPAWKTWLRGVDPVTIWRRGWRR